MENRDSRTLWVGNLHDNVTEEMLYELFLQTGPIEQVRRPKDRETQKLRNFAFITYKHACSVPYTLFVLDGVSLFGRRLNIKNKTGSDQGNSKAQQNNDTYGLGLLPHPSYGKGVLPADLSDWVKDEPRQRQYERGMSGPPMMPGMGMPPGMMGMRPPMNMGPMGSMAPMMMMGPRGPMHPMMMMGQRGGGGLNRSNTWHGDVGDLSRGSSRGGGSRDDRRGSRDDDDRRHRDRERKRDRSPPDNRRSDSSSASRYEEKRGRYDDRDQHGGGGRHGNSSGAGSSRGNHGNGMDIVNSQVQHLAQRQMQMLQQQQMHMMQSPGRQQHQQHDSRQNRRR